MTDVKKIIKNSWQSHFWTNFATTAVLTLSFSLVFGALLGSRNLGQILSLWGDQIQVTIYLNDNISATQKENLEKQIHDEPGFDTITYVDKSQAFKSFEKSLSSYGPKFMESVSSAGDNPFPSSFVVRLKRGFSSSENIQNFSGRLTQVPGVEDVNYGQEWLKNYTTLMKVLRSISLLIAVIILIGCIFTVSNSIQASLVTRREEIEIMELVGATSNKIRAPFLIEGAFQGFISSVLSLALLGVFYRLLMHTLESILGAGSLIDALSFLSITSVFALCLFGTFVGAFGSYVCVAKYNTGWSAAQGTKG
jgi:cell division transport system permease protein